MIRRQLVATAAMERFRGRPLELGRDDCAKLGAFVLRRRGHVAGIGKAGPYRSVLGATRALRRIGCETLEQAIDAVGLPRIPPAAALPADLILIPGEGPFGGAITMAVGNGRVLGWHEALDGADVLQPLTYIAAWRT